MNMLKVAALLALIAPTASFAAGPRATKSAKASQEISPALAMTPVGFWMKAAQGWQNAHMAGQNVVEAGEKSFKAAEELARATKAAARAQARVAKAEIAAADAAEKLLQARKQGTSAMDLWNPAYWMGMKR